MSSLKSVFASAAIVGTLAFGGAALAGAEPVTPVVSVPSTSVIIVPVISGGAGGGGSLPTFFVVTPPPPDGATSFTFLLRGSNSIAGGTFGGFGGGGVGGGGFGGEGGGQR
jgi:hypothetical protein